MCAYVYTHFASFATVTRRESGRAIHKFAAIQSRLISSPYNSCFMIRLSAGKLHLYLHTSAKEKEREDEEAILRSDYEPIQCPVSTRSIHAGDDCTRASVSARGALSLPCPFIGLVIA